MGEQYSNRHSLAELEYNSPTNDKRLLRKIADINGAVQTFAVEWFCGRNAERTAMAHFVEFDVTRRHTRAMQRVVSTYYVY